LFADTVAHEGYRQLASHGIEVDVLTPEGPLLEAADVVGFDAVIVDNSVRIDSATAQSERLRLVARWGAGLDNVDVAACTGLGVVVTASRDSVRRPVATAMLAALLSASHNVVAKDRLVRSRDWDRTAHIGKGLTGRTLGMVGLGNIGLDFVRIVEPFDMRVLAYDPYVDAAKLARDAVRVELTELESLLRAADFVVIACVLNRDTENLIDAAAIRRMKRGSIIVNLARGPILDQNALVEALNDGHIRAAALDVFHPEPPLAGDQILSATNASLSPHSLAWTEELISGNTDAAIQSVLDVAAGRVPSGIVDSSVLTHPRLRRWLRDD